MEDIITTDILVLPFFGQGHLFPCVELCKNFSSHNCKSILIIPSHLSSSIPSNLHLHPSVEVLQIPASYSPPPPPPHHQIIAAGGESSESGPKPVVNNRPHQELGQGIESFLSQRYPGQTRPGFVVMDVMMSWSKDIFKKENIPVLTFFTSGACSTALEYAAWKAHVDDMRPGETRVLPGLPEIMSLSYSELQRRDPHPPRRHDHTHNHGGGGGVRRGGGGGTDFSPPKPGLTPRWLDEAEGSAALLLNTCDDLEGPFIEYLNGQIKKPVFGVGPLLPETYWKSTGSLLHDRDSRPKRESNYTEEEVIQWLDTKPNRSVIYVSFGSEVGPTVEEYAELAEALGESNRFFIWVIQPGSGKSPANLFGGKAKPGSDVKQEGYYPHGLEEKVGERGLIIKGWAPQLMILSHPSTGGFLSHCGWNSTVEAVGRGIPILAWPIRGDQFYDAKLLVKYLKVGKMVSSGAGLSEMVKKCDIVEGIEMLMDDGDVRDRAVALRGIFEAGYPTSSDASLKALVELVTK